MVARAIMGELPASDLSSMVHGAMKVIGQVTAFVQAMNDLMEKHENLQVRFERLEQECEDVRKREEAARRDAEDAAEALAKLRLAHEALIIEHEIGRGVLHERQEAHDAGRDGEETAEALAELRVAYEALLVEHESSRRRFHKLQEEHDALLEGRRQIAEELGAVISSLRTGPESVALSAAAPEP